jgi:hypothetical protein
MIEVEDLKFSEEERLAYLEGAKNLILKLHAEISAFYRKKHNEDPSFHPTLHKQTLTASDLGGWFHPYTEEFTVRTSDELMKFLQAFCLKARARIGTNVFDLEYFFQGQCEFWIRYIPNLCSQPGHRQVGDINRNVNRLTATVTGNTIYPPEENKELSKSQAIDPPQDDAESISAEVPLSSIEVTYIDEDGFPKTTLMDCEEVTEKVGDNDGNEVQRNTLMGPGSIVEINSDEDDSPRNTLVGPGPETEIKGDAENLKKIDTVKPGSRNSLPLQLQPQPKASIIDEEALKPKPLVFDFVEMLGQDAISKSEANVMNIFFRSRMKIHSVADFLSLLTTDNPTEAEWHKFIEGRKSELLRKHHNKILNWLRLKGFLPQEFRRE